MAVAVAPPLVLSKVHQAKLMVLDQVSQVVGESPQNVVGQDFAGKTCPHCLRFAQGLNERLRQLGQLLLRERGELSCVKYLFLRGDGLEKGFGHEGCVPFG